MRVSQEGPSTRTGFSGWSAVKAQGRRSAQALPAESTRWAGLTADADHRHPVYAAPVLPPGLSMLWETTDPNEALHSRFAWDCVDQATEWISASLALAWGVSIHDCRRLVISGHNAIAWAESDRGALVIKWSRAVPHFDGLAASTQLLSWLGDRDLPVAVPIRSAGGDDRVVLDGPGGPLSVAVLPELAGGWLDVDDATAVRAAGACLAAVHLALEDYTDARLWRPAEAEPPDRRLQRWLVDARPRSRARSNGAPRGAGGRAATVGGTVSTGAQRLPSRQHPDAGRTDRRRAGLRRGGLGPPGR